MLLEYHRYWGLERPPFSLTPDPDNLYLSKQHRECLLRLMYAIHANKGGALIISANAGDGKTTVLRRLVADLKGEGEGEVQVAFIDHPTLTPFQMIQEMARQLGVEHIGHSKMTALNRMRAHLTERHQAGGRSVVIVDEGQMLAHRPDILQELRILLNFCLSDSFLLSFILSGQRPLEGVIRAMPEFWQRLPVRFFLGNLDFRDTCELIRFRLRRAGLPEEIDIFTRAAYEEIYRFSGGCPRVICSVADLALVVGRSLRVRQIDAPEVVQASADMDKRSGDSFHYYHFVQSVAQSQAKAEVQTQVESDKTVEVPAGASAGSPAGIVWPTET